MKFPKTLKIGGHSVRLQIVKEMEGENPHAAGGWTESQNLIQLRESQTQSQKEVTLVHELLHAINYNLTEEQVEFLAQALYQILKDNKLYFDGKDEK